MEHDAGALLLTRVTKTFAATTILDRLSLSIPRAATVAIVGPSGSGKSTLLNLIGALDTPTSGSIRLGEMEVSELAGKALEAYRATRVGFVFQEHHLLPQLTALENVLLPTLLGTRAGSSDDARSLLTQLGVSARVSAFPAQLSGGERQRVAIARALINHPSVLLCDEPTGNLDQVAGATVITLLLQLAKEQGSTVVMVTHNIAHAARFDTCLELRNGQLVPFAPGNVEEMR